MTNNKPRNYTYTSSSFSILHRGQYCVLSRPRISAAGTLSVAFATRNLYEKIFCMVEFPRYISKRGPPDKSRLLGKETYAFITKLHMKRLEDIKDAHQKGKEKTDTSEPFEHKDMSERAREFVISTVPASWTGRGLLKARVATIKTVIWRDGEMSRKHI